MEGVDVIKAFTDPILNVTLEFIKDYWAGFSGIGIVVVVVSFIVSKVKKMISL